MSKFPILVALGLALVLSLVSPPVLAQGLPGMGRGMVSAGGRVMIDRAAGAAERRAILARIKAAEAGIAKAFGARRSAPQWQVCTTPACDRANGMTSRAMSYGALLVTISSKAVADDKTYLHEHVHAELASALPFAIGAASRLPNWFDEGLATVISRSAGYPAKRRADCAGVAQMPLPKTRADFVRLSRASGAGPVYMRSACAVLDWLDKGRSPADARARLARGGRLP
ncbi:hypothetical protein [Phaeovulum sp. NW3]|uniref:hypothetical protein n=1 Tax=Phaeovulum sp. NW3 TaxID=2934933 RepID=UPI0020202A53|nr:hypothetical protein [Phaeovulum sp. NW3]MCL7463945.1 hypothetical protein [Phaeovulum sp. NW3]